MEDVLGIDTRNVVLTSAKTGKGMDNVLPAVIE
jgi:translation elongation factor EF-4